MPLGVTLLVATPVGGYKKNEHWRNIADKTQARTEHQRETTAFYVATHAVSVHAALALMLPDNTHHWAVIDPCFGLCTHWDIIESTRMRMSPATQVAGTAMVVDAVVCLKMLVQEGIAPLLESGGGVVALVAQ